MASSSPHPARTIAARRLEIVAAARAAGEEALRFDPAHLRFSLATSLTDVRIPVQMTPAAAEIVRASASELAMLLVAQHRHFVPVDDLDRVILAEGYGSLPAPSPNLGAAGGGADLRAAAQLGPAAHPALTGGIVSAWMGHGGRGRSLTALFIELLQQAFREMEASREHEETPLIVLLALFAELVEAEGRVRAVLPAPPVDRYLRAATCAGLWIAARTGLARAWRTANRLPTDPVLWKLEAVLSAGALMGLRSSLLGGATLYGCELAAAVPHQEDLTGRLFIGGDPDAVVGDLVHMLEVDDELSRRAEMAVAVAHVRRVLLAGISAAESEGRGGSVGWLRDLYTAPGALASAFADDRARQELAARMAHGGRLGGEGGVALEWVGRILSGLDRRQPTVSAGLSREAARAEYATAAAALVSDAALERLLAPARKALVSRTGGEAEGGADTEWEEGRLYRISVRPGPILKSVAQQPLGHLFADVKDFTRRTELLGRAPMAEFLRTEFYRPILAAAKSFFVGMTHLADRGGISINNLLGDAISFSGDIEALVALASEVRRLLGAYQARLAREVSSEAIARQLATLDARYQAELTRLAQRVANARAAGAAAQAAALEEDRARVAVEREQALARARGEGIEAGVFISYGPAPVTVLIDDEVFGQNRVAIAEKINESARGTARQSGARARADAALAAERAATGNAALEHAWSVFVEPPLAIEVPPELERAALASARAGDYNTALRYLTAPLRESLKRVARVEGEVAGEIYNSGAALSEEALTSYLDIVKGTRQLRRVTVDPSELPPALRSRWYFGSSPIEMVATYQLDGRPAEVFRRVGVAAFKGVGAVPVWEILGGAGGAASLVQHFARVWLTNGVKS